MATPEFHYQDPFPLGKDETKYRKIEGSEKYVVVEQFAGKDVVRVCPEALSILANEAMRDVSFLLRPEHNEQVAKILRDPEASMNDKGVALAFLRNAEISAKFELPTCQDTGTATIVAKKGQQVWTGVKDEEWLSKGVYKTYTEENLRYSQTVALDMYEEINTGTNLPAQIDIQATDGDYYKFLFMAKGGGSANKTMPLPGDQGAPHPGKAGEVPGRQDEVPRHRRLPALPHRLRHRRHLRRRLHEDRQARLAPRNWTACRPQGNEHGQAFRDLELEAKLLDAAQKLGIGAQFGGKYFAHDIRVIRLPRHGASCPIGMAVSCSADRNIKAKITRDGLFVEEMDRNPGRFIPDQYRGKHEPRRQDRPEPADEGHPGRTLQAPGLHPAPPQRHHRRRPRHRPRQVQGDPRRRQAGARIPPEPPHLLRRPGQDPAQARHPAPSARPRPAGWTPTSTCSSPRGPA